MTLSKVFVFAGSDSQEFVQGSINAFLAEEGVEYVSSCIGVIGESRYNRSSGASLVLIVFYRKKA